WQQQAKIFFVIFQCINLFRQQLTYLGAVHFRCFSRRFFTSALCAYFCLFSSTVEKWARQRQECALRGTGDRTTMTVIWPRHPLSRQFSFFEGTNNEQFRSTYPNPHPVW